MAERSHAVRRRVREGEQPSVALSSVSRVLARPRLWPVAVTMLLRIASPGWWRRRPYLPIPDRGYLAFRLSTAYGTSTPAPGDLVDYLDWCRGHQRSDATGLRRSIRGRAGAA